MDKSENHFEAENAKLKQLLERLRKTICNQAMHITELEEEKDNCADSIGLDDIDMEEIKAKEQEFKSKIALLQQQIEDERTTYETELAEYKSTVSKHVTDLEKQHKEKNRKIKNLELILSTTQNIKPDPGFADEIKLLEEKNCELQSKCDDSDKKIKELEVELQSKVSTESSLRKTMEDTQKNIAEKEKLLQKKIDKLQSKCDDSDKKIKSLQIQLQSKTNSEALLRTKVEEMMQQSECQKKLLQSYENKFKAALEEGKHLINNFETQLESQTNKMLSTEDSEMPVLRRESPISFVFDEEKNSPSPRNQEHNSESETSTTTTVIANPTEIK
uniref:Uncharacterized protein n=1 Tax=Panagrolaimus superbus TaxID=310955 RepID=A0A914YFL5_9BILA